MKIGIQTWGSDGDILPFIALAKELSAAGHDVRMVYTSVTNKDYTSYAANSGISIIKAYERIEQPAERVLASILRTRNSLKELALTLEHCFDPAVEEMYAAAKRLCRESDLVIGHAIHYPLAIAAEKSGCPRVSVAFCPILIKSEYASPLGPSYGRWLNLLLWQLSDLAVRKKMFRPAQRLREKEGLAPYSNLMTQLYVSRDLTLIATCRPLCPRLPDWGPHIQICGFLNPAQSGADWAMPGGLRQFLEDGAPPVYFTFGSLTRFDAERTTRLFVDSAESAGVRAIIQSDWDHVQLHDAEPKIYSVQSIPHEHVFPHCSLVVHHGGSGTTQSTLQAGKPSLVVAHAFDQPYWGKKLHQIGVAGKVLHRRSAKAADIAENIRIMMRSTHLWHNAQKIGRSIQSENGLGHAVAMIEAKFSCKPSQKTDFGSTQRRARV